jgi:hypothetical protein
MISYRSKEALTVMEKENPILAYKKYLLTVYQKANILIGRKRFELKRLWEYL